MTTTNYLQEIRILYVEDEKETREELHEFLKRRVGKIHTASNGLEGVALYKQYTPDIIIVDLFMPEMGGLDMVKTIKHEGGNPSVIITSAINDVNVILSAVDVGIDKYIIKPINVQELLDELSRLAEKTVSVNTDTPAFISANKKQLEDAIKKDFAAFLKSTTGKGPKDVKVFIHHSTVEISASEILTPMEKSLLDNFQNIGIIEHDRKILFSVKSSELCQMVSSHLNRELKISEVSTNVEKDLNKIVLSIL